MAGYGNSGLASALMAIGQTLPNTIRQNRLDLQSNEDRLRKQKIEDENQKMLAALNALKLKSDQQTVENTDYEIAQRKLGDKSLEDFNLSKTNSTLSPSLEYGKPLSDSERIDKYSLRQYTPFSKGADSVVKGADEQTKLNSNIDTKDKDRETRQTIAEANLKSKQDLLDEKLRSAQSLLNARNEFTAGQNDLNRQNRLDIANTNKQNSLSPEEKTTHAQSVLDKIDVLEKNPGFSSAVGAKGVSSLFGLKKDPLPGTSAAGFTAEYNALRSMLTLENLGKLKGTLSDSDMKVLSQAASSLDLNMPEKDFRAELSRVKSVMSKIASGAPPSGNSGTPSNASSYLDEIRARRAAKK